MSLGGKLTLVQSFLANPPTYFMSVFYVPKGVARVLERLQRFFLMGGEKGEEANPPG